MISTNIKLYNRTRVPDPLLKPLLNEARKLAGCRGPVVVKVTEGAVRAASEALPGNPRLCELVRGGGWREEVASNGGWVWVRLRQWRFDPLAVLEGFFKTAIHEFVHVADMQEGKPFAQYNRRWRNRPHERRAIAGTEDALENLKRHPERSRRVDDLMLELAEWMEENRNKVRG